MSEGLSMFVGFKFAVVLLPTSSQVLELQACSTTPCGCFLVVLFFFLTLLRDLQLWILSVGVCAGTFVYVWVYFILLFC